MNPYLNIRRSLQYGALSHKWEARRNYSLNDPELIEHAESAFKYVKRYYNNLKSDRSLAAIMPLCASDQAIQDVDVDDPNVTHLSTSFNELVGSTRRVFKCYDCGTNARAIFLSLITAARGGSLATKPPPIGSWGPVTASERSRMMREYVLNTTTPVEHAITCREKLLSAKHDIIFIMSISIEDFGHVWVIEKRFFDGMPRYHHYQSCLSSHLLIDFIEAMDYGRYPMKSIDPESFMNGVIYLMGLKRAWQDDDLRLFVKLFKFFPLRDVKAPTPGFSYTWVRGTPKSSGQSQQQQEN